MRWNIIEDVDATIDVLRNECVMCDALCALDFRLGFVPKRQRYGRL